MLFNKKNNKPDAEYPASASDRKRRTDNDISAMCGVYAGPDQMSRRPSMERVYAGPGSDMRTPSEQTYHSLERSAMTTVYAGPANINDLLQAPPVYPSPAQSDGQNPMAPVYAGPLQPNSRPLPPEFNQPISMLVYAGPAQVNPAASMVYADPVQSETGMSFAPFPAQGFAPGQGEAVSEEAPTTFCTNCGAKIPLSAKFCFECGTTNANRPTQA